MCSCYSPESLVNNHENQPLSKSSQISKYLKIFQNLVNTTKINHSQILSNPFKSSQILSKSSQIISNPLKILSNPLKSSQNPLKSSQIISKSFQILSNHLKILSNPFKILSNPIIFFKSFQNSFQLLSSPLKSYQISLYRFISRSFKTHYYKPLQFLSVNFKAS